MNLEKLHFKIYPEILKLVHKAEQICGQEIEIRTVTLKLSEENASASGGFDKWRPFIGINKFEEFDEHALAHEVLHIKRFAQGAYICRSSSPEEPVRDFANDVTNQVEHSVIFCKLEEYGFKPRVAANQWYERKIEELNASDPTTWGPVQETWVAFKAAAAFVLCESNSLAQNYYNLLATKSKKATLLSDKILSNWKCANLITSTGQVTFYRHFIKASQIPRQALYLVRLDVIERKEITIRI